jgi:hypothetical protein
VTGVDDPPDGGLRPVGVAGRLCWYALYPLHRLVYVRTLRGIAAAIDRRPTA